MVNITLSPSSSASPLLPKPYKRATKALTRSFGAAIKAAKPADFSSYAKTASGLTGASLKAYEQSLRRRYALRDVAARLMPDERVARCGHHLAPMAGGKLAAGVRVQYSPSNQSSHYEGLEACSSVWMCSCCAAKITERRRVEIARAMREAKRLGLKVVMCTYTFSHHRWDKLEDILKALQKAWSRYTGGRRADRLNTVFQPIGFIKALEVTYGDINGWHPHLHVLYFLPANTNVKSFGSAARTIWMEAAYSAGLTVGDDYGFKMDTADHKVAWYIAKFGKEPTKATQDAWDQGWNESNELAKWHTKMGRARHVTPMQLLADYAATGDAWLGKLWQEYAGVFKNKRQLFWTPGLKKFFGIEEKTDKELAEEKMADANTLVFLYLEEWLAIVRYHKQVDLLMVARRSKGDATAVADYLYGLGFHRFAPGGTGRRV